jgi:hypothetical protein
MTALAEVTVYYLADSISDIDSTGFVKVWFGYLMSAEAEHSSLLVLCRRESQVVQTERRRIYRATVVSYLAQCNGPRGSRSCIFSNPLNRKRGCDSYFRLEM